VDHRELGHMRFEDLGEPQRLRALLHAQAQRACAAA
jgi:hypothetical protein